MRVLGATVDAGGNGPPTIAILNELVQRGHDVRVLGNPAQRESFQRVGVRFTAWSSTRAWNPRVADPGLRSMLGWLPLASDRGHGRDLAACADAEAVDLVLVDCMIPGALQQARTIGVPVALLVHTFSGYWRSQWSTRSLMGWWLRSTGTHPARERARPDLVVLATLPQLDPIDHLDTMLSTVVVQTGPVLTALPRRASTAGNDAPLLISLSTISYPGQSACLQRVLDAVGGLPARAVATVGPSVDVNSLHAPANVELRGFQPHHELLPTVRGVIGHGGHGTTMLALAHGVPVLLLPMSHHADQPLVAAAVTSAGVGLTLPREATVPELRAGVDRLLNDYTLRQAAARLGEHLRASDGAARATSCLEHLATPGSP